MVLQTHIRKNFPLSKFFKPIFHATKICCKFAIKEKGKKKRAKIGREERVFMLACYVIKEKRDLWYSLKEKKNTEKKKKEKKRKQVTVGIALLSGSSSSLIQE